IRANSQSHTLAAQNTYSGSTTVGPGSTLAIATDNALPPATTLELDEGATFDLASPSGNGFSQTVAGVVPNTIFFTGTGVITNSGSPTRAFTLNTSADASLVNLSSTVDVSVRG